MKGYLLAFCASAFTSIICGFLVVPLLRKLKIGQSILHYVKEHAGKDGTPTMGGVFFIISSTIVALAFLGFKNRLAMVVCCIGVAYALVGFIDDYVKIRRRENEGLKPYQKVLFQLSVGTLAGVYAYKQGMCNVFIPFSEKTLDLGFFCVPFYLFVFVATTNCVNLTDGLDGLAAGVSYVYLAIIALVIILQTNGSSASKALPTIALCVSGGALGFLLFNTNKASVFMGDTGSLSLGGFIASISIFSGNALYILIVGIIFVLTGLSVIVQVIYFKRTGRRVFLMSPIHHHFQMKGFSEGKIAFAYKLITFFAGAICLIFLF